MSDSKMMIEYIVPSVSEVVRIGLPKNEECLGYCRLMPPAGSHLTLILCLTLLNNLVWCAQHQVGRLVAAGHRLETPLALT